MWCKRWYLVMVMTVLLSAPRVVYGGDMDDVRTLFENDIRLFNAQNNDAFSANAHDHVVLYGILSPFATKGKTELQQLVAHYLSDNTRVSFITVNPEMFVAGDSAVAWGHYTINENPKVGPRVNIHGRYTFTYSKIGGRWFLAAMHLSPLQAYNR